jgi:hypothetical protein
MRKVVANEFSDLGDVLRTSTDSCGRPFASVKGLSKSPANRGNRANGIVDPDRDRENAWADATS